MKIPSDMVTQYDNLNGSVLAITPNIYLNPLLSGNPKRGTYASSVDPDQMPHNAASDQGLHCLLKAIFV